MILKQSNEIFFILVCIILNTSHTAWALELCNESLATDCYCSEEFENTYENKPIECTNTPPYYDCTQFLLVCNSNEIGWKFKKVSMGQSRRASDFSAYRDRPRPKGRFVSMRYYNETTSANCALEAGPDGYPSLSSQISYVQLKGPYIEVACSASDPVKDKYGKPVILENNPPYTTYKYTPRDPWLVYFIYPIYAVDNKIPTIGQPSNWCLGGMSAERESAKIIMPDSNLSDDELTAKYCTPALDLFRKRPH